MRALVGRLTDLARLEIDVRELDHTCAAYRDKVEEGLSERPDVLAVVDEGLRKISAGEGYPNEGCIDTYWCGRLPKMYFFKDKLAFQRPSWSNLKQCVVAYLD